MDYEEGKIVQVYKQEMEDIRDLFDYIYENFKMSQFEQDYMHGISHIFHKIYARNASNNARQRNYVAEKRKIDKNYGRGKSLYIKKKDREAMK